jgi:hypothetical protein
MPTTRLLLPFLLLGLVATGRAQDHTVPPTRHWSAAEQLRRLGEPSPRDIAWAAFLVRRDGTAAAVPALRRALARLQGHDDEEGLLARLQLLDALLGFDVRLAGEELLPHATGALRVPTLLLAAKSPEVNSAYFQARMAARADEPDLEWRACGDLLAAQRDPRFFAECVQHFAFVVELTVVDERRPSRGSR